MIKANFNTYSSYVTDSLYQWNKDQTLEVHGVNISVAPEVHFSNAEMSRAIVRQSTLKNGVISVKIPNSLLQSSLDIKAYIGTWVGTTFSTIETVVIPIIAREKPLDYVLDNKDEEFYSFSKLENEIANMVTLESFNSQVAKTDADIKNREEALKAQIANIIVHNGDVSSNTELIDLRTDIDGKVHTTAGEAVRSKVDFLNNSIIEIGLNNGFNAKVYKGQGLLNSDCNGLISTDLKYHTKYTSLIPINPNDSFLYKGQGGYGHASVAWFDKTKKLISKEEYLAREYVKVKAPVTARYVLFASYNDLTADIFFDVKKEEEEAFIGVTKEIRENVLLNKKYIGISNNEVEKLKESIFVHNKNLWNKNNTIPGYLDEKGNLLPDNGNGWETCNYYIFIPENKRRIKASHESTGYRVSSSIFFLCEYDATHNPIKFSYVSESIYVVSEKCQYIRLCVNNTNKKDYQLEFLDSGIDPTAYEPYRLLIDGSKISDIPSSTTKKWIDKKWVCVGDSLTEANIRTTKHYHDYVADSTGIKVINMGVSGSGYKKREDSNNAFYQRVNNIPIDCDVITIFGSGNDLSYDIGNPTDTGTTTLCGCINKTIDTIISKIPSVSLGIVSPTPWVGNQPTIDDTNVMARYTKALSDICKIRSIPFLDLYHTSNLRPWTDEGRKACYSKDEGNGVHPDEKGHKLIAPRFKAFLEQLIM